VDVTLLEKEIPFNVGDLEVVLEGFAKQGNYFVLVLHGIHATSPDRSRVETKIEAQLVISSDSGELVLDSFCYSGPIGSDVLFDISGKEDQIPSGVLTYIVRIKSVMFLMGGITSYKNIYADEIKPAEDHYEAVIAALSPYGEKAQLAAYAYDGDTFYAVVLERENNMVLTHKDMLRRTTGGWIPY